MDVHPKFPVTNPTSLSELLLQMIKLERASEFWGHS